MRYSVLPFLGMLLLISVNCVDSPTDNGNDNSNSEDNSQVTVTDIDGNVYTTVEIGNKVWTVENLRTTRYADGTPIPHVTNNIEWGGLSTPAYCFYNNTTNADSIELFGALYNWWVVDPENPHNIAPEGWRVSTDEDWDEFRDHLIAYGYNWDGSTPEPPLSSDDNKVGKALASDCGKWTPHNIEGTVGNDQSSNNSTGFSALPGGFRGFNGYFFNIGDVTYWWSASDNTASEAYNRYLRNDCETLFRSSHNKRAGASVRLVRDAN